MEAQEIRDSESGVEDARADHIGLQLVPLEGQKGGFGPHRREPRMYSDEQGRTSECIPGLSKMNLGMHS